jgi:glyoxylase-like metal-dependent hydrolase (beta-lactamase superfamily II)
LSAGVPDGARWSAARRSARLLLTLALVAVLGVPVTTLVHGPVVAGAAAREWRVDEDLVVSELRPGIWRHTSWSRLADGTRMSSNGLLVQDGDELVLVDTAWGEAPTEALLGWATRELGRPVTRALATHSHEDRIGGPVSLARRGIPLLVHPATLRLATGRGVDTAQPITAFADGDVVQVGGLEVFHPGAAHARDNVVVWIARERLLFGGCAVKSADATTLGFVGDADLARWPGSMRRVRDRYPEARMVVPGHGDPGDRALLDHTLALLAAVERLPPAPSSPHATGGKP